jgi:hypothetical protein
VIFNVRRSTVPVTGMGHARHPWNLLGVQDMTDFDFGSVYGSTKQARPSAMMAILSRITGLRSRLSVATDRAQGRSMSKAAGKDRAYLADIGMEIGF